MTHVNDHAFVEDGVRASAGFAVTALSSPSAIEPAAPSRPYGLQSTDAPGLERCDYCGCSRHACGCDARFEYEQIRDNPTLFAR